MIRDGCDVSLVTAQRNKRSRMSERGKSLPRFWFPSQLFLHRSLIRQHNFTMQSLRSTSVRRLCLSLTASIPRRQQNPLLSTLFCHTMTFTSASPRWNSDVNKFSRRVTEGGMGEESREVEEDRRCVTPYTTLFRDVTTHNSSRPVTNGATNTLFLGNIPWSTTEHDLQEIFSEYGPIARASIGTCPHLFLQVVIAR